MAYLPLGVPGDVGGPDGYSYGAVMLRTDVADAPAVEGALRELRFTGWVAPESDGWIVALGDPGAGVVARGRRGVLEVGADLAARLGATVLVARVRRDRQLGLAAWHGDDEVARYCSDPSEEPDADREVLSDPVGVASAPALAALVGRPEAAEALTELLDEDLDTESVFESERLRGVLRLLSLPDWVVAAGSLPRDIPTGPRAAELTRMRVGRTGAAGVLANAALRRLRRRWSPPPVIADPPREGMGGMEGIEPWMF